MNPVLQVIVCSTRPGRAGSPVGRWAHGVAQAQGGFDAQLLELADFGLPVFDEPEHPRTGRYQHAHTRRWSRSVAAADAFVFVMPEYNYAPPSAWLNAMTFLVNEWQYKPAGFVSYGGAGGGVRAVQLARQVLTTFKMVPMLEAVALPNIAQQTRQGELAASPEATVACQAMLGELLRWARVLPELRAG